jgi:hypothetical protein
MQLDFVWAEDLTAGLSARQFAKSRWPSAPARTITTDYITDCDLRPHVHVHTLRNWRHEGRAGGRGGGAQPPQNHVVCGLSRGRSASCLFVRCAYPSSFSPPTTGPAPSPSPTPDPLPIPIAAAAVSPHTPPQSLVVELAGPARPCPCPCESWSLVRHVQPPPPSLPGFNAEGLGLTGGERGLGQCCD